MEFIMDPSLVLYLPLYELDGASFRSKDAYGRLCTSTDSLWQPNGHRFNGSTSIVSAGNILDWSDGESFTLEAWFKEDGGLTNQFIVRKYPGSAPDYGFGISSTKSYCLWRDGSNTFAVSGLGPVVTDGAWHHMVAMRNAAAGLGYFYLDVLLLNEGGSSDTTGAIGADASLVIGASRVGNTYVTGIIGEVRIYARALTPQEIGRNYHSTKWRYR